MIIDVVPRLRILFLEVRRPLAILFIWDVLVTVGYYILPFTAPALPLTIFGSALALFLGFRANSAYQRWWEGRVLWGQLINASRSIVRITQSVMPEVESASLVHALAYRQIAYVNALRCQLRGLPVKPVIAERLSEEERQLVAKKRNIANGLLSESSRHIASAVRKGWIDTIQQASIESTIVACANAQGGMERIKNTPLPNQYRFYPSIFTRLFCLLLPIGLVETLDFATPIGSTVAGFMFLSVLQIGDDLVDPFSQSVHGLPLDAMCRTIEIDTLDALGKPAPEPVKMVEGVLW